MARHAAPAGYRPPPPEEGTSTRPVASHRAHRASHRNQVPEPAPPAPSPTPVAPTPPATRIQVRGVEPVRSAERLPVPEPLPLPASMRAAAPKSPPAAAPEAQPATARVATLERPAPPLTVSRERSAPSPTLTRERPAPQPIVARAIEVIPEPIEDEATERVGLAVRVAQLPRVLLDTVAWGGFAAVVALIVIALSDVGMGRAALWALGLSGIVVLAVAVMAVTGTHLDELNRAPGTTERPD